MATTLQFRRGTTAELAAITGAEAELFVDTDKGTVVVMDGATAGGIPLATEDYVGTSLNGYATESYVTTAISNIVDAAPAALDTLNELAAALGDDANFASTVTSALATKITASSTDTLTNKTFTGYTETVFALGTSGTISLDPTNGTIQTCALSGTATFTDSISNGQSIILMLTGGDTNVVTWPTITWVTSVGNLAPTLTAANGIVLWKINTTLYGAIIGSYV